MNVDRMRLQNKAARLVEQIVDQTVISTDSQVMYGDSYIEMLRNAITNNDSRRQSGSGSRRGVVISCDALDLMMYLQRLWGCPLDTAIVKYHSDLKDDYLSTYGEWEAFVGSLQAVIKSIEDLLNPNPKWHVNAACPLCQVSMVWRFSVSHERVQQPAVEIDVVAGARCLACGAVWAVSELVTLAELLGCIPMSILLGAA